MQNSSPALVINVCFIDWSAGKPWRRAERATKRDRRRGNGANHLHRRRLDLITTLSALLPGAVSSSPLLAFEQQSRLTFSLLPSATHSHRLAICFNFFRGLQFRTDTRILGGRIEGESAALTPRRLLFDRSADALRDHFSFHVGRPEENRHRCTHQMMMMCYHQPLKRPPPFSARLTWGSLPTYFCVSQFSMIDDSGGHLWLLFAAESLIRPPTILKRPPRYADEQSVGRHFSHFFPPNPTSVLPFGGCTTSSRRKMVALSPKVWDLETGGLQLCSSFFAAERTRNVTTGDICDVVSTAADAGEKSGTNRRLQQEAESCSWQRAIGSSIYIRLAASLAQSQNGRHTEMSRQIQSTCFCELSCSTRLSCRHTFWVAKYSPPLSATFALFRRADTRAALFISPGGPIITFFVGPVAVCAVVATPSPLAGRMLFIRRRPFIRQNDVTGLRPN